MCIGEQRAPNAPLFFSLKMFLLIKRNELQWSLWSFVRYSPSASNLQFEVIGSSGHREGVFTISIVYKKPIFERIVFDNKEWLTCDDKNDLKSLLFTFFFVVGNSLFHWSSTRRWLFVYDQNRKIWRCVFRVL